MKKEIDEQQLTGQHDEKVFREGEAIFSEDDLRELINYTYSEYQYKSTQLDRLVNLIKFLTSENKKYQTPELAVQSERLNDFLNTFRDFLERNFRQGEKTEDGDIIYFFQIEETSSENEAFLAEFQMVSMDVEKAYRNYRAVFNHEFKK
jgi:hypothetical protein